MWSVKLSTILKEFCALIKLNKSCNQLLETGALLCGDIPVSILPVNESTSAIRILVQMGMPPDTQNAAIYRRLLEINLLMPQQNKEKLSVDPVSGNVIFSYELETPTAEALMLSLQHASSKAHEWQLGYFLDEATA